jgi:hypothetical protein
MEWVLIALASVSTLAFVALWLRTARRAAQQAESDAARARELEERVSRLEARRHDAERRAAAAEQALRALREAAGLEGARPVARVQVEDLHRSASLVATCLAGGDGLPHAGAGPLDVVESLAAFAGALAPRMPSGVTLVARDEHGAELGARLVHVGGAPRVLVAESRGTLPLGAFERTALRLDPEPAPPPRASARAVAVDARLAPLIAGTSLDAALSLPERAGVITTPEAGARLLDALDLLETAHRWLDDHDHLRASSVQLRDPRGFVALLSSDGARVAIASSSEALDVLTEQRIAGIARRRLRATVSRSEVEAA